MNIVVDADKGDCEGDGEGLDGGNGDERMEMGIDGKWGGNGLVWGKLRWHVLAFSGSSGGGWRLGLAERGDAWWQYLQGTGRVQREHAGNSSTASVPVSGRRSASF